MLKYVSTISIVCSHIRSNRKQNDIKTVSGRFFHETVLYYLYLHIYNIYPKKITS